MKRRRKEDNLYTQMQEQSLELLQQLSGEVWTDYNEHDPGITIMDVLHYVLFENNYRQSFDFEEYIGNPFTGRLDLDGSGFFGSGRIFEPSIVTASDYENLITEQIPDVQSCEVSFGEDNKYIITIEIKADADWSTVKNKVFNLYHQYRNLAENLAEIKSGKVKKKSVQCKQDISFEEADETRLITGKVNSDYRSVMFDLPDCYGVNERGLPPDVSGDGEAKAKQLKAYLLLFDYMLSGMNQQRKNIHALFDLTGKIPRPFSYDMDVAGLKELLDTGKAAHTQIFDRDEMRKQKTACFDFLDRIYGENTDAYMGRQNVDFEQYSSRRALLLKQIPLLNTHRLRSFNITDKTLKSTPVIKQLAGMLADNDTTEELPVINAFSRYNLKLVSDIDFYENRFNKLKIEFVVLQGNTSAVPISKITIAPGGINFSYIRQRFNLFWHNIVFESLLVYGQELNNYTIYSDGSRKGYSLLFKPPIQTEWINLGFFFEQETLTKSVNMLCAFLHHLYNQCTTFYVVEHALLLGTDSIENNIISIVLPKWVDWKSKSNTLTDIIDERLPAHLEVEYHTLPIDDFFNFEQLYFLWRAAMANNDHVRINTLSIRIKEILKNDNNNIS